MRRLVSCAVLVAMIATGMFVSPVLAVAPPIIYQNVPNPVPGNVSSEAFQAQTVSEFGDRIVFEPATSRLLNSVEVLMSSWGCESGRWENNDCSTTPNLTFNHPITINIYNVGPSNSVGSLIDTRTQTFAIPYRPSKDDTNCTNPGTDSNAGNDLGKWYSASDDTCYNGFTFPITFDLTSLSLTAPDEVIVSIAYNTTGYGPSPLGSQACDTVTTGCGYDSLNVGLSSAPANVTYGTNPAPNDAYMKAHVGGSGTGYCTNTNLDTFRLDGSCYNGLKAAFTVYASSAACSTVCYVDDATGNDSNSGASLAEAKKTIQGGIDAVDVGGTVIVNDGIYNESPDIDKSLTLESINGRGATTIQLQTGPTYLGLFINGDRVTVDGFTIAGRDGTPAFRAATNIEVNYGLDDIVIKNNKLRVGAIDGTSTTGDDGFGIITYYNVTPAQFTDSVTVTDNIFEPMNTQGRRAFYVNPGVNSFTFQGNSITGNFSAAAVTQADSSLVQSNTVTGTGSSAGLSAAGYTDPFPTGPTRFQGNTISNVAVGINVDELNNVTVTRNLISSSSIGVRVRDFDDFASFDPATIGINRNNLAVGSSNSGITADTLSASVDGTCNWWGHYTGPGTIASGSGSHVTANVEYAPWLQSSNLDAECSPNGNMTIILQTHPEGSTAFKFTGTNGIAPFTLVDNGTPANIKTFNKPAGIYTFQVGALPKWALISLTCNSHQTILKSHRLVQITLHSDEDVTCTFTESFRKPDAMIGTASGGPYSGDNIYSGGVMASQTRAQSFTPGQTKSFWVKFQNDGLDTDSYRVTSQLKGSLKYKVVFMAGTTEITGKVNAGTYKFNLVPGATRMIEVRVTADATVTSTDVRNIILTMQSRTASAARDTVKAFVNKAP